MLTVQLQVQVKAGFVNAAATDGTLRPLTEAMLKSVIADCWNAGATPTIVMLDLRKSKRFLHLLVTQQALRKQKRSKLTAAIDVYISDFGELRDCS